MFVGLWVDSLTVDDYQGTLKELVFNIKVCLFGEFVVILFECVSCPSKLM